MSNTYFVGPLHSFGHENPSADAATVELVNELSALAPAVITDATAVSSFAKMAAWSASLMDESTAAK